MKYTAALQLWGRWKWCGTESSVNGCGYNQDGDKNGNGAGVEIEKESDMHMEHARLEGDR